jgi:hypothetical protein
VFVYKTPRQQFYVLLCLGGLLCCLLLVVVLLLLRRLLLLLLLLQRMFPLVPKRCVEPSYSWQLKRTDCLSCL